MRSAGAQVGCDADDNRRASGYPLRPEPPRTRLVPVRASHEESTMKKITAALSTSSVLVALVAVVGAAAKWN